MVQVIIILFLFIGIYCGINAEKTQLSHTEIHKMKKSWTPFHCLSTTLNTTSEEILVIWCKALSYRPPSVSVIGVFFFSSIPFQH